MKGVILAGGTGTRLRSLTKAVNKHLLPIYDKPMIYYPIYTLVNSGITSIMVVTDKRKAGDFLRLLGSGEDFGAHFTYGLQDSAKGIGDALLRAKDFVGKDNISVILGDNIVLGDTGWIKSRLNSKGRVFLKEVDEPSRYGVANISQGGELIGIDEKPQRALSKLAVTGIYQYSYHVFEIVEGIKPSARGEIEITDVNNELIKQRELSYQIITNPWIDAGTVESLYEAQTMIRNYQMSH